MSRLDVIRQSHNAPIREIWQAILDLRADWLVNLADDDEWEGLATLAPSADPTVTVVAPDLWVSPGPNSTPTRSTRLQTQHVLHGLLRGDVLQLVSAYLASAPMPWGGEDMLLLSSAESLGTLATSGTYRYTWDSRNWQGSTQEHVLRGYLQEAGWGHMASLSTYLLCQSLDRLAIASVAVDFLEPSQALALRRRAMEAFWPVTDPGHRRSFMRLPAPVRRAVMESRGLPRNARIRRVLLDSAANALVAQPPGGSFEDFSTGNRLIHASSQVAEELIPALRREAPNTVHEQIDFWEKCIRAFPTDI
jgi:hypothetical protein